MDNKFTISEQAIQFFTYGCFVRFLYKEKYVQTFMKLQNFMGENGKKQIIKLFVPQLRSCSYFHKDDSLRIRMINPKLNFRIKSGQQEITLNQLQGYFQELIKHTQQMKFSFYHWQNKFHYCIHKMNLEKNTKKIIQNFHFQKNLQNVKRFSNDPKNQRQTYKFSESLLQKNSLGDLSIHQQLYYTLKNKHGIKMNENECKQLIELLYQNTELKIYYYLFQQDKNYDFNKSFKELLIDENIPTSCLFYEKPMKIETFIEKIQILQQTQLNQNEIQEIKTFFKELRNIDLFKNYEEKQVEEIYFEEFVQYFFSSLNSIYDPQKKEFHQDMNQPLCNYFISSSHNTYLVGHQLVGDSGIEGYWRALEFGYRCLELDVWDGKNNEPKITHGFTFVSDISFESVIQFIAKEMFCQDNHNPLILSLEMNVKEQIQRDRVAEILQQYFKEKLFILDENTIKNQLLSPQQLRNMVLIKNNSTYPLTFNLKSNKQYKFLNDKLSHLTSFFKEKFSSSIFQNSQRIKLKSNWSIQSYSNKSFAQIISKNGKIGQEQFIDYTSQNILRIFPYGFNFASQNYDPLPFWLSGAQIVAFNIQTSDEAILINKTFFKMNGDKKGGYILKPDYLINRQPKSLEYINIVKIDLISMQLFREELLKEDDIYIKIYLKGHPQEEKFNDKQKYHLRYNFINPKIDNNRNIIKFRILYTELCFIMFKIKQKDKILAWGCLPTAMYRKGLRVLPLYNEELFNDRYSFLLMRMDMQQKMNKLITQ